MGAGAVQGVLAAGGGGQVACGAVQEPRGGAGGHEGAEQGPGHQG
jgi:hypothetical protein